MENTTIQTTAKTIISIIFKPGVLFLIIPVSENITKIGWSMPKHKPNKCNGKNNRWNSWLHQWIESGILLKYIGIQPFLKHNCNYSISYFAGKVFLTDLIYQLSVNIPRFVYCYSSKSGNDLYDELKQHNFVTFSTFDRHIENHFYAWKICFAVNHSFAFFCIRSE